MYDENATAEKRLLAAVVALAVKDMCLAPIVKKKGNRRKVDRPRADAITAYGFLFDRSRSGLDEYASWLDFDADRFRENLINACFSDIVSKELKLDDKDRMNFRRNYKLLKAMAPERRAVLEHSDDTEIDHDQEETNDGI